MNYIENIEESLPLGRRVSGLVSSQDGQQSPLSRLQLRQAVMLAEDHIEASSDHLRADLFAGHRELSEVRRPNVTKLSNYRGHSLNLRLDNVARLIAILGYRERTPKPGGNPKMIELDNGVGLRGLPTARCSSHNLVLQPESFNEYGTLKLIWSCPICEGEEQMKASTENATLRDSRGAC